MRNCFPTEQLPPPTEKSRKYVTSLKILMVLQIIFGVLKLPFNSSAAVSDLISSFIIYQGYMQLAHTHMALIVFFNGITLGQTISLVGTVVQDGYPLFKNQIFRYSQFGAAVSYSGLIFYTILIMVAFFAYREFKAIIYESYDQSGIELGGGGAGQSYLPSVQQQDPSIRSGQNPAESNASQQNQSSGAFQAFSGKGVTIG